MNIGKIRKLALNKREDLRKINNILNLLRDDMCFFKIDINLSIPILLYIGIVDDKVKDFYFQLIYSKNYKKDYNIRNLIVK